jgi:N-acetylmuramoyl-L-alanine amidase
MARENPEPVPPPLDPPQPAPPTPSPQFAPPLPDYVPAPPARRSYRSLAWAAVILALPILAALAAPANVRRALLEKIQPISDSVTSRTDSGPDPSPPRSSTPKTNAQPLTSASDSSSHVAKADTAVTAQHFKIVIDPGHGGADSGSRGPNGLLEKSVCLEVALRLGQLIEDGLPGSEVVYTRSEDQSVSASNRDTIANESSADLFISIHADSISEAQGPQTYYFGGSTGKKPVGPAHDRDPEQTSLDLAREVQNAFAHQFKSDAVPMRAPDQPAFAVLIKNHLPAVVVEIPFSDSQSPLLDPAQRQQIAEALYAGIAAYLKSSDRSAH